MNNVEGHSLDKKRQTPSLALVRIECSFEDLRQHTRSFSGTSVSSMVMCADHPGLTFTLSLVRTEPTYNQPMQQWSFVSDFAVSPYAVTKLRRNDSKLHHQHSLFLSV